MDTWGRHEEIADLASIAVFPRRGHESAVPPAGFTWMPLELPGLEVSSTDIRRRAAAGVPIVGLVPSAVRNIVESHRLYVPESDSP